MVFENKYEFNHSQIGVVGENAISSNNTFQQSNSVVPIDINLDELRTQLSLLKESLITNAKTADDFNSIGKLLMLKKNWKMGIVIKCYNI